MKNKKKAPNGAKCTSTASGGMLKCVLQGDHDVHSTRIAGRKGAQFATWSLGDDGRIWVTSYNTSGKEQGKWDEDPPAIARKPMTLDDEPQDDEADASALAALEEEDLDDASRTIERCGAPRIGIPGGCQLFERHDGEHFALLHGLGHAWTSGCDPNIWDICGAKWSRHPSEKGPTKLPKDGQTVCARPDEHEGKHRGLNQFGNHLDEWEGDAADGGMSSPKTKIDLAGLLLGRDARDEAANAARDAITKAEVAAVFAPNKNPDPSLADACPKCGFELGQHTGKKCPKAVKSSRQKHDNSEPTEPVELKVYGHVLRNRKGELLCLDGEWRDPALVGATGYPAKVYKSKPAASSAATHIHMLTDIVPWTGAPEANHAIAAAAASAPEIDIEALAPAAAPVKFTDLCLKCGLTKHPGKCAKAVPEAAAPAPRSDLKILGYRRHPAAALFPLMEGADFERFADGVQADGLLDAIVIVDIDGEDMILDGSNRALACERRNVTPRFERYRGATDLLSLKRYSCAKNDNRRHLDPSVRAMIAADAAQLGQGNPGDRETGSAAGLMTQAEAGKLLGVSERLVRQAVAVRNKGTPKVKEAVMRSKLSVEAAEQLSRLPANEQDEIADEALAKKDGAAAVRTGRVRSLVKQKEKRATVRKINEGRVMPMPLGPFGVIYGDYPWLFENSDQHEGSRGHMGYPPMTIDEIIAHARDTRSRAAENSVLALWVPNWHIVEQMKHVLQAYGAVHRTVWTWPKPHFGVGTWGRGQTEHLVIAEIGTTVHTLNEVSTLLPPYPLREHSRKPDEVAELLLKHCSGPHLELFGREPREGYAVWGAEPKKFASEAA